MSRGRSRLDAQAYNLHKYCQRRAQKGDPEARRDWLYAPALVPGGAWNADEMLDTVIRRLKDLGAAMNPPFEMIYVYARVPVWTWQPSEWVRDRAQIMELQRELGAQERWQRTTGHVPVNPGVAGGTLLSIQAAIAMLEARSPDAEPATDPVLARIDAAGMAN